MSSPVPRSEGGGPSSCAAFDYAHQRLAELDRRTNEYLARATKSEPCIECESKLGHAPDCSRRPKPYRERFTCSVEGCSSQARRRGGTCQRHAGATP